MAKEKNLDELMQESAAEWKNIERLKAEREKKDKKIISMFCAENNPSDILKTYKIIIKNQGIPHADKEVVKNFKENYPDSLSIPLILEYKDIIEIYSNILETGGIEDE